MALMMEIIKRKRIRGLRMGLGKVIEECKDFFAVYIFPVALVVAVIFSFAMPKHNLLSALKGGSISSKAVESKNDDLIGSVALGYDVDNMTVTLQLASGEIKEYKLSSPLVSIIGYSSLDKDTLSKLSVYLYNEGYVKDVAIVYWNENTKELVFSYGEEFRGKQTVVFDGESFKAKQ